MYFVSSGKSFWDRDQISKKPEGKFRDINLVTNVSTKKTRQDYQNFVENNKVLILCHGYNNELDDVLRAYKTIVNNECKYTKHFDTIVGYTWPAGDNFLEYHAAKKRASAVARRFADLLKTTMSNCSELAVMSHSMGCRVSLLACEDLIEDKVDKRTKFCQFLMAAAVDNESVEKDERYYKAASYADNTYAFHSKNDDTLSVGYRIAEWDRALGHSGPENPGAISPKTKVINCKTVVKSHGAYKRTQQVYEYIRNELTGNPAGQYSTL